MNKQPNFSKPVDIKAFITNALGLCGCAEYEPALAELRAMLQWADAVHSITRPSYTTLFGGNSGVFYLLAGALDNAGLIEHGVSIRNPFLTGLGEQLLYALENTSVKQIENAAGEAYDGSWYGD